MIPCQTISAQAKPQVAAIAACLPVITTTRLILRAPALADWPVLEPIWTSNRARHIGGPMSAEEAWLDFNQLVAGWILRGHGALTICDKTEETVLGLVILGHEWGDPAPELGWLLTEAAEGKGYATEAAEALLPMARQLYGEGFVSYIAAANTTSARVAARLGATPAGPHPLDATVTTYRYPSQRST